MFKLLKGGECYAPANIGINDVLIVNDKIAKIEKNIPFDFVDDIDVIDCRGNIVCPGFIDQHVHITGGGGEEGAASSIPELTLSNIISAGVTTVVGLLGFDGITKTVSGLLSKARALQSEGLNSYIYTGSYFLPPATLTGKVSLDIIYVDKILGVGEIAIADYRSSHPTIQELKELAAEVLQGGMLSGKAGVVHLHVGDGKGGLSVLFKLIEETDFPIEMFVPTHLNRNGSLLRQSIEFAKKGGYIDLTAGEKSEEGLSVLQAIITLLEAGVNIDNITVSSDGNGSMPSLAGEDNKAVCSIGQLYEDIRNLILESGISPELALKVVTSNVAKVLKLYPCKGTLQINSDADILVLDKYDLRLNKVFINGRNFVDDGRVVKTGRYEK